MIKYGAAVCCVACRTLTAIVLFDRDKERICVECLQKEYITICAEVEWLAAEHKYQSQHIEELNGVLQCVA